MKKQYIIPVIEMIDIRTAVIMAGSFGVGVDTENNGLPINAESPLWNEDLEEEDLDW